MRPDIDTLAKRRNVECMRNATSPRIWASGDRCIRRRARRSPLSGAGSIAARMCRALAIVLVFHICPAFSASTKSCTWPTRSIFAASGTSQCR